MYLLFVTFVIAIVLLGVHNHECKNYNLSASDQSLIDMMKHYLHTSRREECPTQSKTSNTGVTYVRWGKKNCPKGADIVYTGQAGGNQYSHKGGGVNYLCLPNDPENGQHQSYDNDQVYGGEYELSSTSKPSGWSGGMSSMEVPCAVCYRKQRSAILMIPGRKTCYKGWNSEYNGYLMSDHKVYSKRDYACVDKNAEPLDNKNGDEMELCFILSEPNVAVLDVLRIPMKQMFFVSFVQSLMYKKKQNKNFYEYPNLTLYNLNSYLTALSLTLVLFYLHASF